MRTALEAALVLSFCRRPKVVQCPKRAFGRLGISAVHELFTVRVKRERVSAGIGNFFRFAPDCGNLKKTLTRLRKQEKALIRCPRQSISNGSSSSFRCGRMEHFSSFASSCRNHVYDSPNMSRSNLFGVRRDRE